MATHTKSRVPDTPSPAVFAICLLLAASLQIIENLLPKIPVFPWLRFGLTYLVILPFLLRYGLRHTLPLFLCRNLITLMYGAQIFSSFLISTISGLVTLIVFGSIGVLAFRKRLIGLFGVSVLMSLSFNLAQLIVVYYLFIQHSGFFFQITPILVWSLISGGIIAFLIYQGQSGLEELFDDSGNSALFTARPRSESITTKQKIRSGFDLACFIAILFVPNIIAQLAILVALLILSRFKTIKIVLFAWPFFIFIAWLHLFRTDGVYIVQDWITREGSRMFLFYLTRTINLILCGQFLAKIIPSLLSRWKETAAVRGMVYAMPLLPSLFGLSVSMGKTFFIQIRKREFDNLLPPIISKLKTELSTITT